jgi:hypothetical protein
LEVEKMSNEVVTRWYLGKNLDGSVFAVYKAEFAGIILKSEVQWHVPNGKEWLESRRVGEWLFIGNDAVWESTEEEAKNYLPADALLFP